MGSALRTRVLPADEENVKAAARLLRIGEIVAFPTETVYGLGADAFNEDAVRAIFKAKGRPQDNPLIVHVCSPEMARGAARRVSPEAEALMRAFWPGPLSLIVEKDDGIPPAVSAGLDTVALRMPSNEIALRLIREAGRPVAAPSANSSGRPSPTSAVHVRQDLEGKVPLILDGGACDVGVESTVIDMSGETPTILRPGHVTLEQIREVLPGAVYHAGGVDPDRAPASPGMKYRHYAPRAAVRVFEGKSEAVAQTIRDSYDVEMKNGFRPLILCSNGAAALYKGLNVRLLGNGPHESERTLFSELRRADDCGADVIYFHLQDEMGMAVRNRIMKASLQAPQGGR